MAQQGGKRPGAGRPKGVKNKKTQERLKRIKSEGITPLDYMLQVMRDESEETSARMDAAHKAAPYVHAKLASVDHTSSDGSMATPISGIDVRITGAPTGDTDQASS